MENPPRRFLTGPEDSLYGAPEGWRVYGGVEIEVWLDGIEIAQGRSGIDKAPAEHLVHVGHVLGMASLDFGEGLGIEIIVVKRQLFLLAHEHASLFPPRKFRDEIGR